MSGPIVRKYGFPNFEKIFGERELKHGVEDEAPSTGSPPTPPGPATPASGPPPEARPEAEPGKS